MVLRCRSPLAAAQPPAPRHGRQGLARWHRRVRSLCSDTWRRIRRGIPCTSSARGRWMEARWLTDPRVLGGVRSSFPVLLQRLAIILRQGVAAFAAKRTPVGNCAAEVKADKSADHTDGLAALYI